MRYKRVCMAQESCAVVAGLASQLCWRGAGEHPEKSDSNSNKSEFSITRASEETKKYQVHFENETDKPQYIGLSNGKPGQLKIVDLNDLTDNTLFAFQGAFYAGQRGAF